jgi:hypothetical protein
LTPIKNFRMTGIGMKSKMRGEYAEIILCSIVCRKDKNYFAIYWT